MAAEKRTGNLRVEAKLAPHEFRGGKATLLGSMSFAESWFNDARAEANSARSRETIRREIIFAVCFSESYLFEWVRRLDIGSVNDYFLPRVKRPLITKWKEVPKQLFEDDKLAAKPRLDLSDLGTLIKYRNGLVHAGASRPSNLETPEIDKPVPTAEDLNTIKSGWALDVSANLVRQLHRSTDTAIPNYIQEWLDRS